LETKNKKKSDSRTLKGPRGGGPETGNSEKIKKKNKGPKFTRGEKGIALEKKTSREPEIKTVDKIFETRKKNRKKKGANPLGKKDKNAPNLERKSIEGGGGFPNGEPQPARNWGQGGDVCWIFNNE